MLLKVRTIQNNEIQIKVEGSATILDVKKKIEETSSIDSIKQKLIFAGKILVDSQTVNDYGIKDGDKLVLMVSKNVTSSAKAESNKESEVQSSTNMGVERTNASSLITSNVGDSGVPYDSHASQLLTGGQLEETIGNIVAMGFERSLVQSAMRAAFNNPDRAVEYLTSGFIPNSDLPGGAAESNNPAVGNTVNSVNTGQTSTYPRQENSGNEGELTNNESGGGGLEMLRNSPLFHQLRTIVQSDPRLLPEIISRLGQSHPELLQLITENQEEFVRLMEDRTDNNANNNSASIYLTPQEAEAVQRLEALGFSRALAVEAYIICDKNEELAANYLLETGVDSFEEDISFHPTAQE